MSENDIKMWQIVAIGITINSYYDGKHFWYVKRINSNHYLHYYTRKKDQYLEIRFQILPTIHDPKAYGYWNSFLAK